ncbi:MAG: hypothetical protein LBS27_11885 [Bifidobacteriaceae bacterium]|jgi:hypothetical protein|nr:hypothetical protein [Bifidobacteriaceae bacterium]
MRVLRAQNRVSADAMALRVLAASKSIPGGAPLVLSPSTIERYERATQKPHLDYATALDIAYGGEGWILASIIAFLEADWDPWRDGSRPDHHHVVHWPPPACRAWIHVTPCYRGMGRPHAFLLEWRSALVKQMTVTLGSEEGEYWCLNKPATGVPGALTLFSETFPVHVVAGVNPLRRPDITERDIQSGWVASSALSTAVAFDHPP